MREQLRVLDGGDDIEFTLRVLPVTVAHSADCCLLVLFESKDWPAWSAGARRPGRRAPRSHADRDAAWLRQELASTKQYLQSIVDEQEAAAQELRAAHEEVLSSNEELQSTNEELETTKEELQSSNEELTTVNEQFLSRNRELDALTDDLSNFISSADLPMVTVGRDLRIRRLTPAAQRAFNLLPTDVGRSLEHIKFSLAVDGIGGIIDQVISSVQPWEREVGDRDGPLVAAAGAAVPHRRQPHRRRDHRRGRHRPGAAQPRGDRGPRLRAGDRPGGARAAGGARRRLPRRAWRTRRSTRCWARRPTRSRARASGRPAAASGATPRCGRR